VESIAVIFGLSVLIGMIVLVCLNVISVVARKFVSAKMVPALERRIANVYSSDRIVLKDVGALTLGLQSRGALQARGNGALVLAADEVGWFQLVPERNSLRIPRESITTVDTVRSHLGKTYGRELLRVTFVQDGIQDSMAWYVTDLRAWLSHLGEPATTAR
jgi:hypothetical protein